jgi:caa(3)-type oxidase subunit IV
MTAEAGHAAPRYMLIWGVLAVLTLVEVGVAFVSHFSEAVIILILVALAVWKAALVAMYYMHLKFEPKRLIMIALAPLPLAFILVLAVLTEYR